MAKGRWLRSEFWQWHSSFSFKDDAQRIAKYLRGVNKRAVVRKGGIKWDVFHR